MVFLDLRGLQGRRLNQYAITALNCSLNFLFLCVFRMRHVFIHSHNSLLLIEAKKWNENQNISHIIHNLLIKWCNGWWWSNGNQDLPSFALAHCRSDALLCFARALKTLTERLLSFLWSSPDKWCLAVKFTRTHLEIQIATNETSFLSLSKLMLTY